MATRFQIWVDSPTDANSLSYSALASDAQRSTGFISGTAASSSRVNTMLRQNSLAIVALMDTICPDSTVDLRSDVSAVKTEFVNYFGLFAVGLRYVDDTTHPTSLELTLKNNTKTYISLADILTKTAARATADEDGNNIKTTYATKTELNQAIQNSIGDVLNMDFPLNS